MLINTVNAEDLLTATIIGSGSPKYNENRASASVLVSAGKTKILVDMGNGTQANLHRLGIKVRDLSSLFFTHHHLDHNEEFVPILINALMGRNNFNVVGPANTIKLTETNLDLYQEDIEYRLGKTQRTLADRKKAFDVKDIQGGESFKVGDIKVSTVEVPHTIQTIAYRFDYKGQSIVITGDLTYSEKLPKLAKNADFMIIDSGGMVMQNANGKQNNAKKRQGNNDGKKAKSTRQRAHLDLADSSKMAQLSDVKNLVYTHFNTGNVDQEASLKVIQKNYAGHVIFGEDLMVLHHQNSSIQNSSIQNSTVASNSNKETYIYQVVDTAQTTFYSNNSVIADPSERERFFGQDASFIINSPSYTNNNDGTITDNVTQLMWQQRLTKKLSYQEALEAVKGFNLGGHSDWRIANVKELYSLIQFTGSVKGESAITPFIDTDYFQQPLGDVNQGEREIDAQVWSSTEYVSTTMKGDKTVFGVNFVDGRIKGYPKFNPRTKEPNKMYFRFVRGNEGYGENHFVDNNDGTITDTATGLMWQTADSDKGMNWQDALTYSNNLTLGGHDDWRLPNAKELQSIVDYSRSPATSNSAAIDSVFKASTIKNEAGEKDYPYYWSSTTHLDGPVPEKNAVYIAFGKSLGQMRGSIMDVHGAGAQRSDSKTGEAMSRGPQGDMIRVNNYVRSVRGGVIDASVQVSEKTVHTYSKRSGSISNTLPNDSSVRADSIKNERPKNNSNNRKMKFIERFDKDHDNKVSMEEFKGRAKRFQSLDQNRDGYITVNEAPTGPPK
ncbi:Lcl domain-containing protein [Psychromonas sp. L1A2]|uniref:Lcl domain-containing protein n=1 Tax=Psychromonas sp. L1A2 TaxID=2686356 RepID=UPI001F274698|nr:DUF1566 domain-containing protein [Psychromonas sp. L1A2]